MRHPCQIWIVFGRKRSLCYCLSWELSSIKKITVKTASLFFFFFITSHKNLKPIRYGNLWERRDLGQSEFLLKKHSLPWEGAREDVTVMGEEGQSPPKWVGVLRDKLWTSDLLEHFWQMTSVLRPNQRTRLVSPVNEAAQVIHLGALHAWSMKSSERLKRVMSKAEACLWKNEFQGLAVLEHRPSGLGVRRLFFTK